MARELGPNQAALLRMLNKHGGTYDSGATWYWESPSRTKYMLRKLIPRGFVAETEADHFEITPAGRERAG